jgi:hypothetical protein
VLDIPELEEARCHKIKREELTEECVDHFLDKIMIFFKEYEFSIYLHERQSCFSFLAAAAEQDL